MSIYCLVTISILLNTCVFIFVVRLVRMNLLESILPMFEYDYVSGDCFSISLGRFGKTFLSDVRSTECGGFAFLASGFAQILW